MEVNKMDNKKLNDKELDEVVGGGIPDPSWQILNASPNVGGVCGEDNGIIIDNSHISSDPTYGAGIGGGTGYSPETHYGGICGPNGVHYDQIVIDPVYPEK